MHFSLRSFATFATFATLAMPAVAHAEEPAPPPPASALPAPAAAPAPSTTAPVVVGAYTCAVGEHAGVDESDARTTTDVLCHELASKGAAAGAYEVRFGRLGQRILLVLAEQASREDRRLLLQSLEEVPVAAPRLVEALVQRKSLEQTQTVDNVVSAEARARKAKPIEGGAYLGIIGATAAGAAPGASAGVDVGIVFRSGRAAFGGHGRAGGIGSADNKLSFVGIDLGARYHLGDGDIAPFVGAGLGFSYFNVSGARATVGRPSTALSGSGLGAVAEAGLELFRSSHVGLSTSVRADLPFFVAKTSGSEPYYYASGASSGASSGGTAPVSRYVVPISLNLGLSFH